MKRNSFLKILLSLPFGGFWARQFQSVSEGPTYLLNKFYVAGFQYYEGPSVISEIQPGETLKLAVDPDNDYDKFAVAIYRNEVMLGHVPRSDNKHISRLLQQQVMLHCRVRAVNPGRETWEMLNVSIHL